MSRRVGLHLHNSSLSHTRDCSGSTSFTCASSDNRMHQKGAPEDIASGVESSEDTSLHDHELKEAEVSADDLPRVLKESVFFIGFMGAGKTTVARRLARMCGVSAIDMDMYIERSTKKKVSEIFKEQGEEGFREIETQILRELSQGGPSLISCGGGVILKPENRKILKSAGFVVYLEVPVEEAASRISDTSTRPLFSDIKRARQICADRIPLYRETADICIDTSGKEIGRIAREVKKVLRKEGIL